MKKNLYRFIGAFVALLGLAYLGHQMFLRGSQSPAAPAPVAAATPAAPPAATSSPIVANTNAYAVYPDKATDTALGLSYSSFNGDFARNIVMTPLPPNMAGQTTLRIQPQKGQALNLALTDKRCASPVQIVVSRITDKNPVATRALTAAEPTLSIPFADGNLPPLLVEVRMSDKAENNYFCGVAATWPE